MHVREKESFLGLHRMAGNESFSLGDLKGPSCVPCRGNGCFAGTSCGPGNINL